jgi:NACHT domain/Bacterial regulatory proteins, luxR family
MNRESFDEAFAGLTERRKEVLEKVLAGETNDAIAKSLIVSPATVRKHIEEICDIFSIARGSLRERPSRRNPLIALFAKYKPELLSGAIPELLRQPEPVVKKTRAKNSDSFRAKQAIAPFATEDIEALVQSVRLDLDKTLQKEYGTLYTFNLLYTPMGGNLSRLYVQTQINKSQGFGSFEFSQEKQLWQEVVLRNPKLMVLGKPGAGKTTLLQYIAVRCDEVEFQLKLVPVFVSLKNLTENTKRGNEIDLLAYIRKKYCRSRISEQELETLLNHGRLLFLLDGLDEVTEDKVRAVVSKINSLVNEYEENRFIVSCRKEYDSYKSKQFCNFAFCKVADFGQEQIELFINNWFEEVTKNTQNTRSSKGTQLIEKLKLPENQRIRELADTPLLLHLICLIFHEKEDLPSQRVDLYKECINLLLEKWNRFNARTKIDAPDIDLVELRKALRQVAALTFEQGKSYFEQGKIQQFIQNCPHILSDIEVLSGILVKKTWQTYAFSHQTFQEYLTAEALSTSEVGWRKVLTHIAEPRWREVFCLMMEMLPETNNFIYLFKQKINELRTQDDSWEDYEIRNDIDISISGDSDWKPASMSDADLQMFLRQVNQKSCAVTNHYKSAAIRAFYLSCSIIITNFWDNRDFMGGFLRTYVEPYFDLSFAIDSRLQDIENICDSDLKTDYRLTVAFKVASKLIYKIGEWCCYGHLRPTEPYSEPYSVYELSCELYSKLNFTIPISAKYDYEIGSEQLNLFERETQEEKVELYLGVPSKLLELLQKVKSENSVYMNESLERLVDWWRYDGWIWGEKLKKLIIEQRNIGHKQRFEYNDHFEVLTQYYKANKVLIECLNSGGEVPENLRIIIEENLLLPLESSVA